MRRRIAKLEMSLTPKQIVLLWLKEAQEFPAFEQYLQNNAREPLVAAARVLVSNKVTKAVQATRHKLLSEEAVKKLTIEAKKEADFLVMLAFNINAQLLRESNHRWASLHLIWEQYRRMVLQFRWKKLFDDEEWTAWRKMLVEILSQLSVLKASIAELCKIYFEGHDLVFLKQREEINCQIEFAEFIVKLYSIGPRVPSWTAIELESWCGLDQVGGVRASAPVRCDGTRRSTFL